MSVDGWQTLLVLGGIRSGKSEFAEALVAGTTRVRYVATGAQPTDDPEWDARIERHRGRRPAGWTTEEVDTDPSRLVEVISAARADETLLVDDLGGWVSVLLDPTHQPADDVATIAELAAAVRGCAARLVLVSPEVGLSLVPLTPVGRAFADALGATNQAVAAACDAAVLVVAGQPNWLKSPASAGNGRAAIPAQAAGPDAAPAAPPVAVTAAEPVAVTAAEPVATDAPATADQPVIEPGMDLPMPSDGASGDALERLGTLDFAGRGLGHLDRVVRFAAATQNTPVPAPWRSVRLLLIHGDHDGGAAAGGSPAEAARRAAQARAGAGALASLAAEVGATVRVVEAPRAAPLEEGPALTAEEVDAALRYGWQLVAQAAEEGVQAIVLGACGAGAETAATAVLAVTAGAEPAAVLGRVIRPGGRIDDAAWMIRCAAVRDALHRTRRSSRASRDVLAELGGGDIAVATGVLLGAAAHRLPVLLDGPVGVAAALVSRDLGGQARHWCLLPDHGGDPTVRFAADVLDLEPLFDLRVDLGEGAAALAALPQLRSALILAATLPVHPELLPSPAPEPAAEPAPEPAAGSTAEQPTPDDSAEQPTAGGAPAPDGAGGTPGDDRAPAPDGTGGTPGDVDAAPDGAGGAPGDVDAAPDDGGRGAAPDDGEFAEPEPAGPGPARAGVAGHGA